MGGLFLYGSIFLSRIKAFVQIYLSNILKRGPESKMPSTFCLSVNCTAFFKQQMAKVLDMLHTCLPQCRTFDAIQNSLSNI